MLHIILVIYPMDKIICAGTQIVRNYFMYIYVIMYPAHQEYL